jgi:hypothetical protein
MQTITTAIATNNPSLVKDLVHQGWIVGPSDVENLIKQTNQCQSAEVFMARMDLSQLLIDMRGVHPMSVEAIQSLPYNHANSPMGAIQRVENKFLELLDLWAKEIVSR